MPKLPSPTKSSKDSNGYEYVEVSDAWAKMCSALPCFPALHWPDYDTKCIEMKIDGHDVVVQLWKGRCDKFLGQKEFPGGIGGEVGIYRRIPGHGLPDNLDFLPLTIRTLYEAAVKLGGNNLWWPYPELGVTMTFEFINPKTGHTFFKAGPETGYWLTKWMRFTSYTKYKKANKNPTWATGYIMKATVNGVALPPW